MAAANPIIIAVASDAAWGFILYQEGEAIPYLRDAVGKPQADYTQSAPTIIGRRIGADIVFPGGETRPLVSARITATLHTAPAINKPTTLTISKTATFAASAESAIYAAAGGQATGATITSADAPGVIIKTISDATALAWIATALADGGTLMLGGYAATQDATSVTFLTRAAGLTLTLTVLDAPTSLPVTSIGVTPDALSAMDIGVDGFLVRWTPGTGADGAYLEVARDSAFTDLVADLAGFDVGASGSYAISPAEFKDLEPNIRYYARLMSYAGGSESSPSAAVAVRFDAQDHRALWQRPFARRRALPRGDRSTRDHREGLWG